MEYTLHFGAVWASFDKLLSGLALGLGLAVAAVAIGTAHRLLSAFASVRVRIGRCDRRGTYVALIRNTAAAGAGAARLFRPAAGRHHGSTSIESFIGALALYSGAYLTEVFRAGLLSVPKGVSRRRGRSA